jgi:hypothetical protein
MLTYRVVSLFAKKSLFVLIQKVTKKIKTTRMLPRSLPVLHAFFAVPVLRTFTSPKKLNRHSRLYAGPPLLSGPALFLIPGSIKILHQKCVAPVIRKASGEIGQNDGGLVRNGRA